MPAEVDLQSIDFSKVKEFHPTDMEAPKDCKKKVTMSIDEMLVEVGEYGKFQRIVNAIFCFMAIPPVFQIMMMYFAAHNPDWKCSENSTRCRWNGSFPHTDERRCSMERSDWDYVLPREYSLVTQFDIHCESTWIIEVLISIYFFGWIIGSIILGWFADNFGRKIVIFVSMAVILVLGFITPFLPSIYLIILCRFIIGVFTPGTYQQMFTIIIEITGGKCRGFAGNIIFVCVTSSMAILGFKAYFIREWKLLYIVCTVPYIFVLLFYKIVPKSVRYLAIKGKEKELHATFEKIARWNKKQMPVNVTIAMPVTSSVHKSNPIDLFRKPALAKITVAHSLSYIVGGITFYGLYLAAGDIGGSMYRDYAIVTCSEIPFAIYAIDLSNRIGRKRTTIFFFFITMSACFGLVFTPKEGNLKIARIILGMFGKCCCGAGYNIVQTWTMELYPTYIRGEGVGFLQVLTRFTAAGAPWVNEELYKIHKSANFIIYGILTLLSIVVLIPLVEHRGQMAKEDDGMHENDRVVKGAHEKAVEEDGYDSIELKEKHSDKNGFTSIELNAVSNGYTHVGNAIPNGYGHTVPKGYVHIDNAIANGNANTENVSRDNIENGAPLSSNAHDDARAKRGNEMDALSDINAGNENTAPTEEGDLVNNNTAIFTAVTQDSANSALRNDEPHDVPSNGNENVVSPDINESNIADENDSIGIDSKIVVPNSDGDKSHTNYGLLNDELEVKFSEQTSKTREQNEINT